MTGEPHTIEGMATRIRKNARPHLYITEHMEKKGLSDEDMAGRLDTSRTTVWRWRKEQWRLDPYKIAAIAKAIGIEDVDLYRPPWRESIDASLKDAPDEVYEAVRELATRLSKKAS